MLTLSNPANGSYYVVGELITVSLSGGTGGCTYNITLRNTQNLPSCIVTGLSTIVLGTGVTTGMTTITMPPAWTANGNSTCPTSGPGDYIGGPTSGSGRAVRAQAQNPCSGGANSSTFILPIVLTSFEVIKAENIANVTWSTATETNNDYFTIERSADGSNFTSIGMVDGAGNSSSSIDYSYIDDAPLAGTSYYRLKQTDYDGQFSYSDVRAIQFSAGKKINFAYDAQGEEIRIQSSISDLSVRIVDMAGRVLKTIPTASSLTQVSVSYLQAGTYAVIVAGSSGVSETFKFVR